MQKVETISDLRNILIEEIGSLRNGEKKPDILNAISGATRTIITTVKMQLEYAKFTGTVPDIAIMGGNGKKQLKS